MKVKVFKDAGGLYFVHDENNTLLAVGSDEKSAMILARVRLTKKTLVAETEIYPYCANCNYREAMPDTPYCEVCRDELEDRYQEEQKAQKQHA